MLYFIETFKKTLGRPRVSKLLASGQGAEKGGRRGFFCPSKGKNIKDMKSNRKKTMMLAVISILFYAFLCPVALSSPSFNIPSEYGMIKEEFGNTYSQDGKTIVYIQDAHCNYEAQKNIANILEDLIKNQGIKMVFVEGGSDDSGLSYLKGYGSKEALKAIAEKSLEEGKISGEEYLSLISDLDFEIYGIEDQSLYNSQRNAFLKVDSYKSELSQFIKKAQEATGQLKEKIYNEDLKELTEKKKAYENNEITLVSYVGYLNDFCTKKGINSSIYYDFSRLAEAVFLERLIYYDSIGKEANSLLNRLVESLSDAERESLLDEAKQLDGKTQKQVYDFYQKIRDLAEKRYINLDPYRNFRDFTTFLEAFDSVNMQALFNDINSVNRAIITELVDNIDQWEVVDIDYGLGIFDKMVNVNLDKAGFDLYQTKKELINPKSWVDSLNKLAAKYRIQTDLTKDTSKIEEAYKELQRFYDLAFKRDEVFVKKIFSQMKKKNIDKAVLITGGFHSENLQSLLEEGGARGVIVYPKVSTLTDDDLYRSRVKEELSDLERLVSGREF